MVYKYLYILYKLFTPQIMLALLERVVVDFPLVTMQGLSIMAIGTVGLCVMRTYIVRGMFSLWVEETGAKLTNRGMLLEMGGEHTTAT